MGCTGRVNIGKLRDPLEANQTFFRRRAGKLYIARSRLYRSRFLQPNFRWKSLAEICTMHSFAPLSNI
jgi:hypothetical protein